MWGRGEETITLGRRMELGGVDSQEVPRGAKNRSANDQDIALEEIGQFIHFAFCQDTSDLRPIMQLKGKGTRARSDHVQPAHNPGCL